MENTETTIGTKNRFDLSDWRLKDIKRRRSSARNNNRVYINFTMNQPIPHSYLATVFHTEDLIDFLIQNKGQVELLDFDYDFAPCSSKYFKRRVKGILAKFFGYSNHIPYYRCMRFHESAWIVVTERAGMSFACTWKEKPNATEIFKTIRHNKGALFKPFSVNTNMFLSVNEGEVE